MTESQRGLRERLVARLAKVGVLDLALQIRGALPPSLLSTFTFHRVADLDPDDPFDPDVVDATPAQFRRCVEMLARRGTPVTIDDVVRSFDGYDLPANPFMITFDDGYRSCVDVALPILAELGVPATFFIPTAFPDEGSLFWWDKIALLLASSRRDRVTLRYPYPLAFDRRAPTTRKLLHGIVKDTPGLDLSRFLADLAAALDVHLGADDERHLATELIASWDQVRVLAAAGMDVESHTHTHRVLETLAPAAIHEELVTSRSMLELQLGRPIRAIAYPVGRMPPEHVRRATADAGYQLAFTNNSGATWIWSGPLRTAFPLDRFALSRHATERSLSDEMLIAQFALPAIAY